MFRIRLKITFRFVDEISVYIGANSLVPLGICPPGNAVKLSRSW